MSDIKQLNEIERAELRGKMIKNGVLFVIGLGMVYVAYLYFGV